MSWERKVQKKPTWGSSTQASQESLFKTRGFSKPVEQPLEETALKPIQFRGTDTSHLDHLKVNNTNRPIVSPKVDLLSLQAKLTVGAPGDKYEQEADATASQVMLMPDSVMKIQVNSELNAPNENLPIHQMKTRFYVRADELTQSENIHPMHPVNLEQQLGGERVGHKGVRNLSNEDLIKLGGPNGDDPISGYRKYKDSDDRRFPASDIYIKIGHHRINEIAERVKKGKIDKDTIIEFLIKMPNKEKLKTKPLGNTTIQRECIKEKEETQHLSINASIQRDISLEDEVQTSPSLQRAGDDSFQTGGNIESQLNSSKSGGSPLADNVRSFMEPRFGHDFSKVRVHTGGDAVQMNRELGAQAFAYGNNIYFGAGKSPGNNELTAHELTHVVQQTGGVRVPQLQLKPPDRTRERQTSEKELERRAGGKGEEDGSGEWGRDAKDRGLTDRANHYMWTRVALAAESVGLTNAARHMRHYLGNTGSPLTVNVDNMMRDVSDLADAYTEQQELAMEAANNRIAHMGKTTQAQNFQLAGERMSDVYCNKETSSDWFYAIGGFTYWYTAEVAVIPKEKSNMQVQMKFKLHVYDRYNWDHGKVAEIAGIRVKDEQLGKLHRMGLAREYDINGTSTPRFTEWNYSPISPVIDSINVPKGQDRDGKRSDPSRDRGRHFNNIRGSSGSGR